MQVIVTGGLGFIGWEVALRFRREGHAVTVVDSEESNVVEPSEAEAQGIRVVERTVLSYLAAHSGRLEADLVVHAASPVGAAGVLRHPYGVAAGMVGAAAEMGKACLAAGAGLVFISSSEIYGLNGVLSESMRPRVPTEHSARAEYALGKLTSEEVLAGFGRRGLKYVCLRPFNVVGPRQSRFGGFVLPTFIQQALSNRPITVFEDGKQTRTFLDVADLVTFVVSHVTDAVLEEGGCINVGNPANFCTIHELAARTKRLLGSASEIDFVRGTDVYGPAYAEAASRHKLCDIAKALALGWSPRRSLDEIVLSVADHYRRHWDIRGCDVRNERDPIAVGNCAARG